MVIEGTTTAYPQYYIHSIGVSAFENCDAETVTIEYYKAPTNVFHPNDPRWPCTFDRILWQAFKNCKKLREVTFPKEITIIDVEAFWGCESLEELTFPWGLRTIDSNAFAYCSNLSVVNIDENLQYLGANVFVNCAQQMTLYMKCPPPTVDGEIFSWGTKITVVVPQQLRESYTNHDYWRRFNIVVE